MLFQFQPKWSEKHVLTKLEEEEHLGYELRESVTGNSASFYEEICKEVELPSLPLVKKRMHKELEE